MLSDSCSCSRMTAGLHGGLPFCISRRFLFGFSFAFFHFASAGLPDRNLMHNATIARPTFISSFRIYTAFTLPYTFR